MGEIVTSPVQGRPEGPGKPLSDLVFSQLRINYRPWISVLAVTAVSTGCVLLGMATVQAGAGAPNAVERVYNQLGSSVAAFIAVAAVVAISLTAAVCVRVQRLDVALWMLAGVQPKQAAWVVRCEVWITSLLGSLLGVVLGYAAWPLWVGLLGGSRLPDTPALHAPPPASAAVLALIICLLTALCGGGKAARLTRRVRPLEVLQQTDQTKRAFGWGRAVWAALLGLSVVLCYVAVAIMKPGQESGQQMIESSLVVYLISGILLVALMAVCGQYLLGGSLAAWTGLVPRQLSLAWYLARNRAHADVDFSSALVTPLIVATGTVGALYGWLAAMLDASRVLGQRFEGNGLPVTDVVVSVGGPVLIAAV
ncbi:MAG: hypothetical protein LBK28_06960, partial [Propionibacteriaceae bacterium]|nr:hypothetical protein [Propionibacteriaceae bacterium]